MQGYSEEMKKKRHEAQVSELNRMIAKFHALRTEGEGRVVDDEVETLREELKETRRQRDECMKHAQELKRENQELKTQIETGGPAVVELGSSKKAKLREQTTGDDEVNKWKNIARDCLEDGIPRGMTSKKAAFVAIILAQLPGQQHLQKLVSKHKLIVEMLKLRAKHFNYIEDLTIDRKEMEHDAIQYVIDLLEEEKPLDMQSCKAKMESFDKNLQWLKTLTKKQKEPVTVGKKRGPEFAECRVCGKVGGRLLCEETHPHRVFCGLVCQSKFYYSSSE